MKYLKLILRRIKLPLILLLLFVAGNNKVNAIVNPTNEFYVNDYANILSEDTEKYIIEKSKKLYEIDGTQIVVVTVKNLDGDSLEEYANNLFNQWGIGSKEKNNGLLLLLSLEEKKFRVEVGDGLEDILPDGKTGRFQDKYIIPYFKENKWDEGIKNGYDAFFQEIIKEKNLNLEGEAQRKQKNNSTLMFNIVFYGVMFITLIGYRFKPLVLVYLFLSDGFIIYNLIVNGTTFAAFDIGLLAINTFLCLMVLLNKGKFGGGSSGGYSSFYSGSSWSSSGGSSSSFGGGGSSSGGGSSRSF